MCSALPHSWCMPALKAQDHVNKQRSEPAALHRREGRHLQLNHGGVVAGKALVRGVHERLSTTRPQDVFSLPCSSERST